MVGHTVVPSCRLVQYFSPSSYQGSCLAARLEFQMNIVESAQAHGLVFPTEYTRHEYGFAGYTIPQIRSRTCLSVMAAGDQFEVCYSLELAPKESRHPIVEWWKKSSQLFTRSWP